MKHKNLLFSAFLYFLIFIIFDSFFVVFAPTGSAYFINQNIAVFPIKILFLILLSVPFFLYWYFQHKRMETSEVDSIGEINILKELNGFNNDIINSIPALEWCIGPDNRILFISSSCERLTGYTEFEFKSDRNIFSSIIFSEDKNLFEEHKECNIDDGEISRFEYRLIHKNGEKRWFLHICQAIRGKNGKYLGRHASNFDINEYKKNEALLRESEKKYQNILNNMQDVFYRTDIDGNLILLSPSGMKMFGAEKNEELIGLNIAKSLYKDPIERENLIKALYQNGFVTDYEVQLVKKNKSIMTVSVNSHLYYNSDGNVLGVEGILRDITARKGKEEDLAYERDLLNSLMENIPDRIFLKDNNSNFIKVNTSAAKILGLNNPDEIFGKTEYDFFEKEYAEESFDDEQKIINDGNSIIDKVEKIKINDDYRWILTTKAPIKEKDGRVMGLVGISRDITDLKKAENALRESEERYRILIDKLPDAVLLLNSDGNILMCNKKSIQLHGYIKSENIINKKFLDLVFPDNQHQLFQSFQKAIDNKSTLRIDFILLKFNKISFPAELQLYPVDEGLKSSRFMCIYHDLTKKQKMERSLKESEHKYHSLFEGALDPIVIIDSEELILLDINKETERLLGLPKAEVIGKEYRKFKLPDVFNPAKNPEILNKKASLVYESEIMGADLKLRYFESRLSLIEITDGKSVIQGILHDITDKKRKSNELEALLEISTGLQKAKSFSEMGETIFNSMNRFRMEKIMGGKLAIYDSDEDFYSLAFDTAEKNPEETIIPGSKNCKLAEVSHFSKYAIEGRKILVINDNHSEFALSIDNRQKYALGQSMAFISLFADDLLVGLLSFTRSPINSLDEQFIRFFESISKYLTISISELQNKKRLINLITKVQRSEEKYRILTESSPDLIFSLNIKGTIGYLNNSALKELNIEKENIIGKNQSELYPDELGSEYQKDIFNVFLTNKSLNKEICLSGTDKKIWCDAKIVPLLDEDANVFSVLILARDISDQKRVKEFLITLLKISEGLHAAESYVDVVNTILKNLDGFEFSKTLGGKVAIYDYKNDIYQIATENIDLFCPVPKSSKLEDVQYYSKQALMERSTLVIQDNHSEYSLSIDPRQKEAPSRSMIFIPLFYKDKIVGLLSFACAPVNSMDKAMIEFLEGIGKLASISIGEMLIRKYRQDEIEDSQRRIIESEEKLRSTLSSMDDYVFVLDENNIFVGFHQPDKNSQLIMSWENFIGKEYKSAIPENVSHIFEKAIHQLKISGKVQQFDYSVNSVDQEYWFSAKISGRKDDYGRFCGSIAVIRDITRRVLTEKYLNTLLEISKDLHDTDDFEKIGTVVVGHLEKYKIKEDIGIKLAVYDEKEDAYQVIIDPAIYEPTLKRVAQPLDKVIPLHEVKYYSKYAIEKKQTLLVQDNHSFFSLSIAPIQGYVHEHAMIFIPLFYRNSLVGLLSFSRTPKNSLDPDFVAFLESIGKFVSIAVGEILQEKRRKEVEIELQNAHLELERKVLERTDDLKRANEALSEEIEQRMKAEQTIRQEMDARLRMVSVIEQTTEAIVIISIDMSIEYINAAFLKIFGYSKEELLYKKVYDFINIIQDEPTLRMIFNKLKEGVSWSGQLIAFNKNNEKVNLLSTYFAVINQSSLVTNYVGLYHDITRQVEFEKHLQHAQKMESLGTLAGGIAHDFNNIVTSIIGYADLALEKTPIENETWGYIDKVYKASLRAGNLAKQILAFSRSTEIECIPISVEIIVKEALKLIRASLPATIKINLNYEHDLGLVYADPTQIHQVVMNICTNAFHAMKEKGGKLDVDLRNYELRKDERFIRLEEGNYLKIEFTDSGYGIDPAIMDKIFDPFFTTKKEGEGTGLGLSIVHSIIERHNGFIDVISYPGKGTTFTILLPIIKSTQTNTSETENPEFSGTERVLVVDDESYVCDYEKIILTSSGFSVTNTSNSHEAFEIFRENPENFDLVITDLTMPDMTGIDLGLKLRSIREDIPIILTTGYNDYFAADEKHKKLISEIIIKPINRHDFLSAVRRVLDHAK